MPPMPDSYYELAFELEQPDPIRERFSAAVTHRMLASEPAAVAESPLSDSVDYKQPLEAAQVEREKPIDAAEDLIKDRFVYTPIQLPQQPAEPNAEVRESRGIPAQSASMIRAGVTSLDDTPRQRHFIREPR